MDPELLFLDEPTAGLDPIVATAFDELVLSLKRLLGLTVVMVTHDLDSLWGSRLVWRCSVVERYWGSARCKNWLGPMTRLSEITSMVLVDAPHASRRHRTAIAVMYEALFYEVFHCGSDRWSVVSTQSTWAFVKDKRLNA